MLPPGPLHLPWLLFGNCPCSYTDTNPPSSDISAHQPGATHPPSSHALEHHRHSDAHRYAVTATGRDIPPCPLVTLSPAGVIR
jgi:hypothetical protein